MSVQNNYNGANLQQAQISAIPLKLRWCFTMLKVWYSCKVKYSQLGRRKCTIACKTLVCPPCSANRLYTEHQIVNLSVFSAGVYSWIVVIVLCNTPTTTRSWVILMLWRGTRDQAIRANTFYCPFVEGSQLKTFQLWFSKIHSLIGVPCVCHPSYTFKAGTVWTAS